MFCPSPSTSRSHLISIQAQIFASHIHPGDVYRSCASHIHPAPVSPASKFQYPYLTSTHVLSHFHPGPKFRVSSASMWHLTSSLLTSIQVMIFASQLHPYPSKSPLNPILLHLNSSQVPSQPHPGLWMGVSPPSMSRLTSIQFLIVASLLHPHRVSPPPRSWYLHLISIHVESHLQVARCETCSSALSMFHP